MQVEKERAKQLVRFHVHPVEVTAEDGRKSFVDKIYVQVTNSVNEVADVLAEEDHFKRFAKYFEAFKKSPEYQNFIAIQETGCSEYTPLERLDATPATVANLKAVGVRSVESLLEAPFDKVAHVRGIQAVLEKARAMFPEPVAEPEQEAAPVTEPVARQKPGPKKKAA
jgi:hypothetical protein